jgi:hypothetical protein
MPPTGGPTCDPSVDHPAADPANTVRLPAEALTHATGARLRTSGAADSDRGPCCPSPVTGRCHPLCPPCATDQVRRQQDTPSPFHGQTYPGMAGPEA